MAASEGLRTGGRIRERRLDQGIRQADLAASVGISPSYLNLIEHNRRRIGGVLLADLARVLGVEPGSLTEGAERAVLDRLRHAGAQFAESGAELGRTEELAARYPGWAALIVAQAERLQGLQAQVQMLTDRMAYDPALATSLHAVISAVTSIRSTAAILTSDEDIDADWQRRFHRNIHDDARRLAASSEALINYLDTPGDAEGVLQTPLEELESWLETKGHHFASLENGGAIEAELAQAETLRAPAQSLLASHLTQYAQDAVRLPLSDLQAAVRSVGYDPCAIAQAAKVDLPCVLRRLICLPPEKGRPPIGLAVCDAAGFLRFVRAVPGFAMPRGAACPLWPLFTALGQVGRPVTSDISLPGSPETRMRCTAIATQDQRSDFTRPPVVTATMVVLLDPKPDPVPPLPIGVACRICPRGACPARREPSALADGL